MIGKKINQLATELAPQSTDLTIIGDPISGVSKKITLAQLGAIFSGAVSFYNDLASFPVSGDINVIYCAKDTQKLYLWSGSAYVEVFPSQALLDTYQLRSEKGNANGYASLDSGGKVPISQLPSSIMEYKGTWNAATNTPTLANGTGDTGDVYICNVAGTVNFGAGPITFAVGDYVIYSGTIWQRSSGAVGTVTSVAASITGDSVTISGSPVTTSGTLAFAFAGTGAQYIKGDGTLATFPNTIDQAKNLITEVYNSTGSTLTKGTVVYINGGQGNLPTVTKALATGDSTSAQTYGIVQADITNNNNGFVVVAGRLTDIDTQAFSVGTQLYLSSTTAGGYTSTKQYAPNHLVYIGIIVRSHPTQGVIEVKIQNGYELDELHNVAAQTPTNNDGLFWEASTSLWKNKSIATVLGYTPANPANFVPYTGATGNVNLGTNDFLARSVFIEGATNYQTGLLMKQYSVYNFVTGAYTQIAPSTATELNIVHNQANTTRRRYSLSVAALQDGDSFQYLVPRASGTIALTSDLTGGTVTSVAALTIGTSGTDLSSTVANGTTTPVITLNVPTASATNRGALSSTDWTTFNNKQNALTNPITGISASGRVAYFNGDTSITGSSNFFWDSTNNRLGIGLNNPQRTLEIHNATADSQLRISGAAPSVSLGEAITGAIYQAKFGLITANGQYVTGGVAGDFVMISQTGATIFATSSTEKMRVQASGNVSIGNTNDTFRLDVSGTGRFTSNLSAIFNSTSNTPYIRFDESGSAKFFIGQRSIVSGDAGTGYDIYTTSGNDLRFYTNGSTTSRLTLATTGAATFSSSVDATIANLSSGLKVTGSNLVSGTGAEIVYSSGKGIFLTFNRGAGTYLPTEIDGSTVTLSTSGSPRLTVASGGNVGIGTTNISVWNGAAGTIVSQYSASGNTIYSTQTNSTSIDQGGIYEAFSNAVTSGSKALGSIAFLRENTSTTALSSYTGFYTNNAGSVAERMRITSGGVLKIGNGGTADDGLNPGYKNVAISFNNAQNRGEIQAVQQGLLIYPLILNGAGGNVGIGTYSTNYPLEVSLPSGSNGQIIRLNRSAGAYGWGIGIDVSNSNFNFYNNGNTSVANINNSTGAYTATSDQRLKLNILDSENALSKVLQIKVRKYDWKDTNIKEDYGFVAQELFDILPQYVHKGNQNTNWGVAKAELVPILVKAIQEQQTQINELKSQLNK